MAQETLEAIRDELKANAAIIKDLEAKVTSPEASPEDIEKFDEASAKFKEAEARHAKLKAETEDNDLRADRAKRAAEIADYTKKFETDTIQSPNYNRQSSKQLERYRKEPDTFQKDAAMAFSAWSIGYDPGELPTEMVEASKRVNMNPAEGKFDPNKMIRRDVIDYFMSTMLSRAGAAKYSAGGFSAAITTYADSRDDSVLGLTNQMPTYVAAIATNMVTYGGIMKAPISVETVPDYEDIIETYVSDIQTGRQIGEGETIGTNINPSDGQIVWKNWDFTSDDMTITTRQLERSRMELPMWIADSLGERLGRRLSIELSNGTGTTRPYGIILATIAGGKTFTTATTNVIAYDDLHSGLTFAIDEMFRSGSSVGWMMSETNLQYLMRIKDLEGRPMFNWGWEGNNRIRTLEGYPVYVNREMITTHATTEKPILFGDFSKYKVVFRKSPIPTLIRDDTTNRRTLKVIFTALINCDAQLRNYGNCPIGYLTIL